jgi:hypothetical protein
MALEFEIQRWKGFKKALPSQRDREAFEAPLNLCRNNAMAAGFACNPIIFEPMLMSILLVQSQRLLQIEEEITQLNQLIYDRIWKETKEKG